MPLFLFYYEDSKQVLNEGYDYDLEKSIVDQYFGDSLISFRKIREKPFIVKAKLHFKNNDRIKQQFLREMLTGNVIYEDGSEIYQAIINDPLELMPWLRSWSTFVEILPGEDHLKNKLITEIQEMISTYENL